MQSLNKVAIGRVVMRSKERLVAIRPLDGALCVETMRYADEVVPVHDLVPETDAKLSEKEKTMARQLVESLASEAFEPEKYHDQYREQLLDLIKRKESGAEISAEPQTEAAGEGARPRRRARSVDREVEDREGSSPDRVGVAAPRQVGRDREARHEGDVEAGHEGTGEEGGPGQEERVSRGGAPPTRTRVRRSRFVGCPAMGEGLSAAEVGKEIAEHRAESARAHDPT